MQTASAIDRHYKRDRDSLPRDLAQLLAHGQAWRARVAFLPTLHQARDHHMLEEETLLLFSLHHRIMIHIKHKANICSLLMNKYTGLASAMAACLPLQGHHTLDQARDHHLLAPPADAAAGAGSDAVAAAQEGEIPEALVAGLGLHSGGAQKSPGLRSQPVPAPLAPEGPQEQQPETPSHAASVPAAPACCALGPPGGPPPNQNYQSSH
mmetsp:Transcript_11167/g.30480  ORF Transcript_11167/g.30480 Transcript_11167/m.30480 type:complete len:209 (-) Transcript_11167:1033-1659(-)